MQRDVNSLPLEAEQNGWVCFSYISLNPTLIAFGVIQDNILAIDLVRVTLLVSAGYLAHVTIAKGESAVLAVECMFIY